MAISLLGPAWRAGPPSLSLTKLNIDSWVVCCGFFIPGKNGKNQGLGSQAVRVARVERGVEIDHRLELIECDGGEPGVGVRAIQIAAEGKTEPQLAGVGRFYTGERCRGPVGSAA